MPESIKTPPPEDAASETPVRKTSPWPIIAGFAIAELLVIALCFHSWLIDRDYRLGHEYALARQYDKAIPYYEQIVRAYPHAVSRNYELGLIYLHAGRYKDAVAKLQSVAATDQPPSDINTRLGLADLGDGQYDSALEQFMAAVKKNPGDPVASFYIGEDLLKKKENLLAAQFLEHAAFDSTYGPRAQSDLKRIEKNIFGDLAEDLEHGALDAGLAEELKVGL